MCTDGDKTVQSRTHVRGIRKRYCPSPPFTLVFDRFHHRATELETICLLTNDTPLLSLSLELLIMPRLLALQRRELLLASFASFPDSTHPPLSHPTCALVGDAL